MGHLPAKDFYSSRKKIFEKNRKCGHICGRKCGRQVLPGEHFRLKLNGNLTFVQLSIDRIHRNLMVLKIGWDFEMLSNFKILNTFILSKRKDSTVFALTFRILNRFWYHFFLRIVRYDTSSFIRATTLDLWFGFYFPEFKCSTRLLRLLRFYFVFLICMRQTY